MKKIVSERLIGKWLADYCTKKGFKLIKLNPASYTGLPDRIIMTDMGTTIYVELKTEGETLRPMQVYWKDWLEERGHLYLLVDHIDDEAAMHLEHYLFEADGNGRGESTRSMLKSLAEAICDHQTR